MYNTPGETLAFSNAGTDVAYARRDCISDKVGTSGIFEKGL